MADKSNKFADNVVGKFYVDKECILCSLCVDIAPDQFKESDEGDHDFVYAQPTTQEDIEKCLDALKQCPVDAIGEDG
ncbi:MAG: ferredoxin [Planctomycetes bacterium]|nr:ferredoxin [Planctomycetota bacterium]